MNCHVYLIVCKEVRADEETRERERMKLSVIEVCVELSVFVISVTRWLDCLINIWPFGTPIIWPNSIKNAPT